MLVAKKIVSQRKKKAQLPFRSFLKNVIFVVAKGSSEISKKRKKKTIMTPCNP